MEEFSCTVITETISLPHQETEGPGGGGEGAEEGRAAEEARAEAAGAGGEEEPEEAAAAAGGGAEEAADEDRHGGEEAAAGPAQPGVHPAHRRTAGQGQGEGGVWLSGHVMSWPFLLHACSFPMHLLCLLLLHFVS